MNRYKNGYRINSGRAPFWDYKTNGAYFITICTENKKHYFGRVENDRVHLSTLGEIAANCWLNIPLHFPFVTLDKFIVMPNHIHGIIIIAKKYSDPVQSIKKLNQFGPQSRNLGSIIRGYKIGVVKEAQNLNIGFGWQPRYHDHIIRNDFSYNLISDYIISNPQRWGLRRN